MMKEDKGFDPFRPQQPLIPGVTGSGPKVEDRANPPRPFPLSRIGLGLAGVLLAAVLVVVISLRSSQEVFPSDVGRGSEPIPSVSQADPTRSVRAGGIVGVAEMATPWTFKEFVYESRFSTTPTPAILVRLPRGSATSSSSYWAFVKRAPYGNCDLEMVANLKQLRADFGYAAHHPMVVDPCTRTVYNPLAHASVGDVMVRGDVVKGDGLRPPLAIEVRVRNGRVYAERAE